MCKAIALTFAKKNEDVKEKVNNRNKTKYKTATEYICAAIRSFDDKDTIATYECITKNDMELIINQALIRFKHDLLNSNMNLSTNINNTEVAENDSLEQLEKDLDLDILNIEED